MFACASASISLTMSHISSSSSPAGVVGLCAGGTRSGGTNGSSLKSPIASHISSSSSIGALFIFDLLADEVGDVVPAVWGAALTPLPLSRARSASSSAIIASMSKSSLNPPTSDADDGGSEGLREGADEERSSSVATGMSVGRATSSSSSESLLLWSGSSPSGIFCPLMSPLYSSRQTPSAI